MKTKAAEYPLRLIVMASSLLLFAAFLVGCNTMEGLGEDTEAAGQAIERQAQ